jgi:transposase-like protein
MGEKTSVSRRQGREQFWRRIVSGQPRSGLTVAAWCGEHGVSAPSFYVWRQRFAQRNADRKLRKPQLLPVEIIPSATDENGSALEIELPSQVKVRVQPGCELELLRQVLTMLQQDRREAEGC